MFLKDWLDVFPREQIRVIKMEEYSALKKQVLKDTVHFLELGEYGYSPVARPGEFTVPPLGLVSLQSC